eukprot:8446232-Pyramimonas_sp.AAC.1
MLRLAGSVRTGQIWRASGVARSCRHLLGWATPWRARDAAHSERGRVAAWEDLATEEFASSRGNCQTHPMEEECHSLPSRSPDTYDSLAAEDA